MMDIALKGDREIAARLKRLPWALGASLGRASAQLGPELQRKFQDARFSGQVLNPRRNARSSSTDLQLPQKGVAVAEGLPTEPSFACFRKFGGLRSPTIWPSRAEAFALGRGGRMFIHRRASRASPPEGSFPRSVINEMKSELRKRVTTAVAGALQS
jgi:hypothetical protein